MNRNCCDRVAMIKKEFGKDHLYSEIFIQDDEPYIISFIKNNGNLLVSKFLNKYISIEIKYL